MTSTTESIEAEVNAFSSEETESKIETARAIVKKSAFISAGIGLIPIPIVDFAALSAFQVKMLNDISEVYEQTLTDNWGKVTVGALLSSIAPGAISSGTAASLIKAIPFVGGIIGALTFPAFAGASTYALGQVFISHFESGGTTLDFKPNEWKDEFQTIFNIKKTGIPFVDNAVETVEEDVENEELGKLRAQLVDQELEIERLKSTAEQKPSK